MDIRTLTQHSEAQPLPNPIDHDEPSTDTLLAIVNTFERVAPDEIPLGDEFCPCCFVQYGEAVDLHHGAFERPVRTPCGHLFGDACLRKWLQENTCPLCRKDLYKQEEFEGYMFQNNDNAAEWRRFHADGPETRQRSRETESVTIEDPFYQPYVRRYVPGDEGWVVTTIRDNDRAAELWQATADFATSDLELRQVVWETSWRQTPEDIVRDWRD